jgi:hypothetical protein
MGYRSSISKAQVSRATPPDGVALALHATGASLPGQELGHGHRA